MLIPFAVAYGVTMKVADLLNEHGLKMFRGAPLLFGLLWGSFGAALVFGNDAVANIILAMNIAFIIRNRLDYPNHRIAASVVIVAFLLAARFDPLLFLIFLVTFVVFGSLKDYLDDTVHRVGAAALLSEAMLYYPIPTFIYCIAYGNWIVFWVFLSYTVAYNITKLVAGRYGYR